MRKRIKIILAVVLPILVLLVSSYALIDYQNAVNYSTYQRDISYVPTSPASTSSCCSVTWNMNVKLLVSLHVQTDSFANRTLLNEGFFASCLAFCQGITYTQDPTVQVTNEGLCVFQDEIWNTVCSGYTNEWGVDTPVYIWNSESANTLAATDTYAGSSGPCYSGATGLITTGGLAPAAGTTATGTIGSTVTIAVTKTFTAAETDSNVQASCLMTESHSGSHIYLTMEGTMGPFSLVSGNTLQITWDVSLSHS